MTEAAKVFGAEEILAQVDANIVAFRKGGLCHKAQDIALAEKTGDSDLVEAVKTVWEQAEKLPATEPPMRRLKDGHFDPLGVGKPKAASPPPKIETEPKPKVIPKVFAQPKASPTVRPPDLLALPGICGDIQDYYLRTAMRPSAALSLAPAIIVPATLISGKIVGPTGPKGCSSHLYIMALGKTTAGKQHVADVAKECLNAIKAEKLIGPNRFKSGTALVNFIREQKVSLCVQDEYGPFLAKLSDPKAMTCEREISERLRELWGLGPKSIYNTAAGATEKSIALEGVHLNLLALGVRDEFYVACRDIQVANGLLNRKLIIEEPGNPPDNDNPSTEEFPFKLLDNLTKLRSISPRKLGWDSGAREIYEAIRLEVRENTDEAQANLYSRGPEKYVRLCNAFASARFSSVIERSDGELAYELIKASDKFFTEGLEDAAAKRLMDHHELVREIERRMRTKFSGEATLFQIKTAFKNNKKHKDAVANAVADMVDSGTLVEIRKEGERGRPTTVLRLACEEAEE
jgi:hypothetical protein